MLDGSADLATASDSPVMFRSFERDDYVVIGTFVTTSDDVKLVARKAAGVAQPGDLRGKKIGVVRGASSQFVFDSYLLWNGIDPASVELVGLQPDEMAQALRTAKVDAVAAWEPFAFDAIGAAKDAAVMLPHSGVYTLSFNLVAHRRLAGARDPELAKLLRAVARATGFIREQPREAQAILRARLGVDQRFVEWVWPGLRFQLALDQSLVKTLESEARWAIRSGHVVGQTVPNYLRYMHAAPLRQVDATRSVCRARAACRSARASFCPRRWPSRRRSAAACCLPSALRARSLPMPSRRRCRRLRARSPACSP